MLPLSVRLGSTLNLSVEGGAKILGILCGQEDFEELMRKGYLTPARGAGLYLFAGHPLQRSEKPGTWVAVERSGQGRFVEV